MKEKKIIVTSSYRYIRNNILIPLINIDYSLIIIDNLLYS